MPYDWLIVEANQKRDAEQSQMTWNIEQKKTYFQSPNNNHRAGTSN